MDQKGVSPMIATIVLIAIVFAVAAILALSLASAPQPSVIFSGQLALDNLQSGRDVIVIKHTYGERAINAVEIVKLDNGDNIAVLKNLELRVNGVIENKVIYLVSEGKWENLENQLDLGKKIGKTYALVVGDIVKVRLSKSLAVGDTVLLKWVPKDQSLVEKTITY
ncbi:MAG: archaellin/type IV pilin N-terminal domain-containing protein [Candidatus Hadarchaeales archaeon]